ncbi:hypothetical protein [Pelagicoccus sp. SDUM812003]|uniref:hypothetical protein n=1 Tax=Pelagicoccus sp. SDUM812003 TaxID=3041267 RepID=UPI00280E4545|nr:hypothetical protein [Pelagicoccus sp. SDUM812003]MDQ8203264.1 hypothetical protein [Pelagicoccus sp. SDUM812003]
MKRRRKTEVFSLSFLDCICCGFGAIILLFIVSMGVQTREINKLQRILENTVLQRKLKLADYQIKQDELNVMLDLEKTKRKRLERDRQTLDALLAKLRQQISDKEKAKELFVSDLESLEEEMAVMQTDPEIEQKVIQPTPIGVPVESNVIAFVIDTSGSMRETSTNLIRTHVVRKFEEVITSYPEVKGIQLLDASGHFIMGSRMGGRWLQDSPEMREAMVRQVRLYPFESESNPVPGIKRAIRTLYDPNAEDLKFGIYVFGDEFTGKPEPVIAEIRKLNKDKEGNRIARINAIGFPNVIQSGGMFLGQSGLKFAKLMHDLTYEHGGAFIALDHGSLDDIDRESRDRYPTPPPPPPRSGGVIIRI